MDQPWAGDFTNSTQAGAYNYRPVHARRIIMLPVYFPGRKKRELHTKITVIMINCCNSEVHNIRVYTA